jgi:photosynthetic reaction center H subunit
MEGHPKIVPLRAAADFSVAADDPDPRGRPVVAGDGNVAGTVSDVWVDRSEVLIRYLEVDVPAAGGARRVLLPMTFAKVRNDGVHVKSIFARHFAHVPGLKNPDRVTLLEEERICAYYAGGTLYADPSRAEPWL